MTENLKKFLKFIESNEKLKEKAKELKSENPEEAIKITIAFAKENGFELTEADFEEPEGELAEDELADISGGEWKACLCSLAGGGGGEAADGDTYGCACVGYGQGGDGGEDNWMCICVGAGAGDYTWGIG